MESAIRKRLIGYLLAHKWKFIGAILCGGVIAWADLYLGYLAKLFIDGTTNSGAAKASLLNSWDEIKHVAILLILLQFPKGFAAYFQFCLVASATNRIATTIRDQMYSHLHRMSLSFFERNKIGHLMSRMLNDVGLIQNGSGSLVDAITSPIVVIAGLTKMFMINWNLALVAVFFAPGMGFLIGRITRRMRKLTISLQLKLADVSAALEETIAGIRIVKSFGMESEEIKRFAAHNKATLSAAMRTARRIAGVLPVTELFSSLIVAVLILLGGYLMVIKQTITIGTFAQFLTIGFYVSSNVKKMSRLNIVYHQTMAGVERIFEVLDEPPDINDSPDAVDIGDIEGLVEFRDVSFSYQTGEQVLNDVSFTMEPGKVVAIVGPSGAGKSTIANVVPRFYDVSAGAVLVDGHDVRSVTVDSLRRHIGIVPQETILFSGTIRDNIAYGKPDAANEEIEQAARAANAHDFIIQFENGYKTVIGERGARLSGGERQRISIARAILKNPRILILDEATSSLDATSERLVQGALDLLMKGRTTLVIAHRLSTITKADQIVVLGSGKIIEQGSFDELMSSDSFFSRLYRTQYDAQAVGAVADLGNSDETPLETNQD